MVRKPESPAVPTGKELLKGSDSFLPASKPLALPLCEMTVISLHPDVCVICIHCASSGRAHRDQAALL